MNLSVTRKAAQQIVHRLQQNDGGVVLLHGAMGAGKTTLVGEIVRILCPTAIPCSPTYTIINQYTDNIFHADLYRLWENENQTWENIMQSIGLEDLMVAGNYVFIEWPNEMKIAGAIKVIIKVKENGAREIIID